MAVYLDYNASAPIDKRVLERMIEVYTSHYGNADSTTHSFGTDAKNIVDVSRREIADILNQHPADVIFTSGATESNNMAIIGFCEYAQKSGRNHFITTKIEHKSVLEAMHYLERHGCKVDYVSPDETGRIKPEQILDLITEKTLLVSMIQVNSETGVIQPIIEVGEALALTPVYFHVDGTQGFGKRNEELRNTKYDMLSITAHKLGGPQGVGAIVFHHDKDYRIAPIVPLLYGGPQERGYRAGTTPVALVAGFALAAELCEAECEMHRKKCTKLKESFLQQIQGLNYTINGAGEYCLPSMINLSFHGINAKDIFSAMKNFYAFSNGSACNCGSNLPSNTLAAMGLSKSRIDEALRISWSADTVVDFSKLVDYIKERH